MVRDNFEVGAHFLRDYCALSYSKFGLWCSFF